MKKKNGKKSEGVVVIRGTGEMSAETLIRQAIDRGVPVETMERLLAMRKELKAEKAREMYFVSLSAFQAECPPIRKTKSVRGAGGFGYSYAPMEEIVKAIAPSLEKNGLSYTFNTKMGNNPPTQTAICTVYHTAGHSESSQFEAPIDSSMKMNLMQKSASAQTYAKRYALLNCLGIATADDDNDGKVDSHPEVKEAEVSEARPQDDFITSEQVKIVIAKVEELSKNNGKSLADVRNTAKKILKDFGAETLATLPRKHFQDYLTCLSEVK